MAELPDGKLQVQVGELAERRALKAALAKVAQLTLTQPEPEPEPEPEPWP